MESDAMTRIDRILQATIPRPGAWTANRRRAAVLTLVLVVGVALLILAVGLAGLANQQTVNNTRYGVYKDEFAACELALNKAFAQTSFLAIYGYGVNSSVFAANAGADPFNQQMMAITAPSLTGYSFPTFTINRDFAGTELQTTGTFSGLTIPVMRYTVNVTAKETSGSGARFVHPGVSLSQTMEIAYVPLYCYAIFYDPTMEIGPGADMTVAGLVHCNHDAYFEAGTTLTFNKDVSVSGNALHGRYLNSSGQSTTGQSVATGAVDFTNTNSGTAYNMARSTGDANNDGWLTHLDSDWSTAAVSTWGTGLTDSAQGVSTINLPGNITNPYSIIQPKSSSDSTSLQDIKFADKAGLTIYASTTGAITATTSTGSVVSLNYTAHVSSTGTQYYSTSYTSGGTTYNYYACTTTGTTYYATLPSGCSTVTTSAATLSTFYDAREGKYDESLDINLAGLSASGNSPASGLVYANNDYAPTGHDGNATLSVVKLTAGTDLPNSTNNAGFTVATEDPCYIVGNYNTSNKALAAVAADALTILSNNWLDDSTCSSTTASTSSTTSSGTGTGKTTTTTATTTSTKTYETYTQTTVTTTVTKKDYNSNVMSGYPTVTTGGASYAPGSLSNRAPTATTVNAVCMNGIVPSSDSTSNEYYSGGVENYFRLLENWSNSIKYTFNGSLICMWDSQKASNTWQTTGVYYNAPARVWAWDSSVSSGPPGLPYGVSLYRKSWSMPTSS
jgi:hypothetical protein